MRQNFSALLSSLLAILLPTQSPPQPPNNPPLANPDITWTVLLSQAAPPAGAPPGGSRGSDDQIIPIAPGAISIETWSNCPLFLWWGMARQIELVAATGDIVWQQRIDTDHCLYTGKPLPSGSYEWILYSSAKVAVTKVRFQVMQPEKQSEIAADLAALETQLAAATPEQIALQRANYFAKRQLWSDVFREAFSVINPSEELVELLKALPAALVA